MWKMWTKFSSRPFPRAPRRLVRLRTNSMAIASELWLIPLGTFGQSLPIKKTFRWKRCSGAWKLYQSRRRLRSLNSFLDSRLSPPFVKQQEGAKGGLPQRGFTGQVFLLRMGTILLIAVAGLIALVVGSRFLSGTAMPASGSAAPEFTLNSQDGTEVSLKDYRGKWVVLYFYPKDFTSGCTMEAHNFQRDLAKYSDAGVVILGVSVDTAQSHKDFCAKEGLNFKLLADPDAKVSTEYGSVMDYKGQKLASRNTFIINPNGDIAKVYTGVKPADHSEQVLKDLVELKKSSLYWRSQWQAKENPSIAGIIRVK